MAYQKCPICNGQGTLLSIQTTSVSTICPTCKGARIISEVTGKPPTSVIDLTQDKNKTIHIQIPEE